MKKNSYAIPEAVFGAGARCRMPLKTVLLVAASLVAGVSPVLAQAAGSSTAPIVQPGAPGQANKTLDPAHAQAPPRAPSEADIDFMQGMVMHHSQAVEMTQMLKVRTHDPALRELGDKISLSQTDEMRWMKQWLTDRSLPIEMPMKDMPGMDMKGMDMAGMDMDMPPMPGMLTKAQMKALAAATGPAFDHLFLTGMIQHHTGALTMVKQLFAAPGAGQDPQLFDFANDVDNTQQAEIDTMKKMLKKEKQ